MNSSAAPAEVVVTVSCGNCGAEVDPDWQFCRSCGAEREVTGGEVPAEDTGSQATMSATTETDAGTPRDADTETSRRPDGLAEEDARARRKVATALLIGIVLLVVLLGGGLVVLELLGR